MSSVRTHDLTIRFTIVWQDDPDWPYVATLESVEPRGFSTIVEEGYTKTEKIECAHCSKTTGRYLCDACATAEAITCQGPEGWIADAGIEINRPGVLTIEGFSVWHIYDQDDWESDFEAEEFQWGYFQ